MVLSKFALLFINRCLTSRGWELRSREQVVNKYLLLYDQIVNPRLVLESGSNAKHYTNFVVHDNCGMKSVTITLDEDVNVLVYTWDASQLD
jgi:hypothetical protein